MGVLHSQTESQSAAVRGQYTNVRVPIILFLFCGMHFNTSTLVKAPPIPRAGYGAVCDITHEQLDLCFYYSAIIVSIIYISLSTLTCYRFDHL